MADAPERAVGDRRGDREAARRLGLVSLEQMLAALVAAVENPAGAMRIVEVPAIRRAAEPGRSLLAPAAKRRPPR